MAAKYVRALMRWRLARYMVASTAGTLVDFGTFLALFAAGVVAPVVAAVASYVLGMVLHWFISSRFVFPDRLAGACWERGGQQVLFAASALAGLAITAGAVGLFEDAGRDPRLGKLVAMAGSFVCVFLIRLLWVFRQR
ncbi:GtrA family protein [Qipengyuania gaetbuli]|uniref:GtrA family protein n=1 Tax=Qipengyuania gaetbuli TaxID=266952 RepID=UPI001CFD4522|nr:GtrA family protein [Qipengyuania gaetbuli]